MNKNLYQDALRVIDMLIEQEIVLPKDGIKEFGEHRWNAIVRLLKSEGKKGIVSRMDCVQRMSIPTIKDVKFEFELKLEQLIADENSQKLSDEAKRSQISANRNAKIMAYISLVFSIFSILNQIFKWF